MSLSPFILCGTQGQERCRFYPPSFPPQAGSWGDLTGLGPTVYVAPLGRGWAGPVWTPGDISCEAEEGGQEVVSRDPLLLSLGWEWWVHPNFPLPFLRNREVIPWKII